MKKIIIKIIKIYQKTISPDHGFLTRGTGSCRYFPSCSEYAINAIEKHGVLGGLAKSFIRILKCNPFFDGGVDLA